MTDTMHPDSLVYPNDNSPPDHDRRACGGCVGASVRAVHVVDSYTRIEYGTRGVITAFDDAGRHVDWGNGRTTVLVVGVDRWEVI